MRGGDEIRTGGGTEPEAGGIESVIWGGQNPNRPQAKDG